MGGGGGRPARSHCNCPGVAVAGTRTVTGKMERSRQVLENDFGSKINGAGFGLDVGVLREPGLSNWVDRGARVKWEQQARNTERAQSWKGWGSRYCQGSPGEPRRWTMDQCPELRGVVWARERQGTSGIRWSLKSPGEASSGRTGEPSELSRWGGGSEGERG